MNSLAIRQKSTHTSIYASKGKKKQRKNLKKHSPSSPSTYHDPVQPASEGESPSRAPTIQATLQTDPIFFHPVSIHPSIHPFQPDQLGPDPVRSRCVAKAPSAPRETIQAVHMRSRESRAIAVTNRTSTTTQNKRPKT